MRHARRPVSRRRHHSRLIRRHAPRAKGFRILPPRSSHEINDPRVDSRHVRCRGDSSQPRFYSAVLEVRRCRWRRGRCFFWATSSACDRRQHAAEGKRRGPPIGLPAADARCSLPSIRLPCERVQGQRAPANSRTTRLLRRLRSRPMEQIEAVYTGGEASAASGQGHV